MSAELLLAATTLVLLAYGYVCLRRGRHGGLAGGDSTGVAPDGVAEPGTARTFSAAEVAHHATADDLWLVIAGKVYDFSDYFRSHPGGEAILRNAGRDSTAGFSGEQHPEKVWDMIRDFYIGDLALADGGDPDRKSD